MKSGFDKIDAFRSAMNALAKLNCNVEGAYDNERAEEWLRQLCKSWKMDENQVILKIARLAQSQIEARLRHVTQQAVITRLQFPITEQRFKSQWEKLSMQEQLAFVEDTVALLEGVVIESDG